MRLAPRLVVALVVLLVAYTHIRTADGRDVFVPSAQIFNQPLVNFTRDGLRRLSFVVGIDYGDDTAAACRPIEKDLQASKAILDDPAPGVVVAALRAEDVELEAFFWLDTFKPGTKIGADCTEAIDRVRVGLRQAGFTLSSEVTSNLVLARVPSLSVAVAAGGPA